MSNVKFIPPSLIDHNGTVSNIEMCAGDGDNKYMILGMLQIMREQQEQLDHYETFTEKVHGVAHKTTITSLDNAIEELEGNLNHE